MFWKLQGFLLAGVKGIAPILAVLETAALLLNYTPTLLLLDGRAVCTHRASAKVGHLYAILAERKRFELSDAYTPHP